MSALRLPWQSSGYDSAISMQGAQVQSLVRELRLHMLHSMAKTRETKQVFILEIHYVRFRDEVIKLGFVSK